MEMHQIRYFVRMAECLNFTRAAEQCNVSQPALTRAIRKLEDELGGPLFRREGRRTHLTELGRMVRPRFEQAMSLTSLARDEALDFSRMVNATLNLGCMCTIAPSKLIALFECLSRRAPQLTLTLQEATGQELSEMLLAGDLDVAITASPVLPDDLQAVRLFDEGYVVIFPAGHRFGRLDEVSFKDLIGEKYLERSNCEYLDWLQSTGHDFHDDLDRRFQSENESWVQAMVIAGLGCSIMPEGLALHPELQSRPLVEPALHRTVSVLTRRGRRHTPAVELFVNICEHWNRALAA